MILFQTNDIDFSKQVEALKRANPPPQQPMRQPRFFDNFIGASILGVLEAPSDFISLVAPKEYTPDPLKKNTFTIDPEQTGTAGQISHGLLHGVSAFLTGASVGAVVGGPVGAVVGGAISVALASGRRSFENARDEGADKETAASIGAKTGVLSGIGALIPAGFGTNIVKSMMGSVAVNLGLSGVDQLGSYHILKSNGYDELAEHAAELDKVSIATDVLLGMAFGALHAKHLKKVKPLPSEVDAAMGAKMDKIATDRLNEGVPITNEAHEAHMRSLAKAEEALFTGEPFSLDADDVEVMQRGSLKKPTEPQGKPPFPDSMAEEVSLSMEQKMEALERFASSENIKGVDNMPREMRRDIDIVKRGIFEEAFACFVERGGK